MNGGMTTGRMDGSNVECELLALNIHRLRRHVNLSGPEIQKSTGGSAAGNCKLALNMV
jgi:hypothetical protein